MPQEICYEPISGASAPLALFKLGLAVPSSRRGYFRICDVFVVMGYFKPFWLPELYIAETRIPIFLGDGIFTHNFVDKVSG